MIDFSKFQTFHEDPEFLRKLIPFREDSHREVVYKEMESEELSYKRDKPIRYSCRNHRKEQNMAGFNLELSGHVLQMKGSLHYLYHNNNYSAFTYSQLHAAVEILKDELKLTHKVLVNGVFELGINVADEYNMWDSFQLYKKSNPFSPIIWKGHPVSGLHSKQGDGKRFKIKAYDKTQQYCREKKIILDEEITRFEVVVSKSWFNYYFTHTPIHTLEDLQNREVYIAMGEAIYKAFESCIFNPVTAIDLDRLTDKERHLLFACSNPDYYHKMGGINSRKYCRDMDLYKKLMKTAPRHSHDKILAFQESVRFQIYSMAVTALDL